MRSLRTFATLLLPLLAGGCVASPALMATSSAGDNVAYSETGKSMLDYALSEVMDGDCTIMHGFTRGQFCRDVPKSPVVEATQAKSDGGGSVGKFEETEGGAVFEMTRLASVPLDPEPAAPDPPPEREVAPPRTEDARWAFVLGVFKDHEQAADIAGKLKPHTGIVSSVIVRGEVFYRVTTQPFRLNEAAEKEKPVAALGIPDAKMVAVCPDWIRDETCLILDR